mmetsp:Transcript_4918/g.11486  ORF Transcript_4918/g.11486 Transcript_4918/m.11486 type:complete len:386 (+) Transcript_4918:46-1203(+)
MGGNQSVEVGGFRIFKVNNGSPAAEAGLEVFFDFIVEINGVQMDPDQATFARAIQEAENQRTKLVVHNIRTHTAREVYVTPRRWGGAGLLGAVVRYDSLESAEGQGMRVLSIFPKSPAEAAGLVPNKDFLLGTTEVMFRDMDELTEVVNLYMGKELKVYVYNTEAESIREVVIVPSLEWGGDGAIGADIRTGLLHRIPAPRRPFNIQSQVPPSEPSSDAAGNRSPPDLNQQGVKLVDLQQVQPLLEQVQQQLHQLQGFRSQGELTETQQQQWQQLLHMQQLLQSHVAQIEQRDSIEENSAAQPLAEPALQPAQDQELAQTVSEVVETETEGPRPNGQSNHSVAARGSLQRSVFELPPAAKAAAAALPRTPFETLSPGIIYETAVS